MDIRGASVSPEVEDVPSADDPGPPSTRRGMVVGLGVGVLLVALWQALTWELDYFAFSPGSATPTGELVVVDGVETFPPDGTFYFTTVSSRTVTVLDWIGAQFDPAVELRTTEEVLGGRTTEERRSQNAQAMRSSQDVAELVALEALGFDVFDPMGALVSTVGEDTAADGVLDPGDVVVAVDGAPVITQTDLVDEVRARSPGDEVTLRVVPAAGGPEEERVVELGESDEGGPLLGVAVTTMIEPAELPVDIEIDSGNVGGPSAGLAWTLTIMDVLTPGELTGGARVAITGTIDLDGNVGPIGGVQQKTFAVREQGIEVFIVPELDAPAAREVAGDDLVIVGVATLDEALDALAELGGNADELVTPDL